MESKGINHRRITPIWPQANAYAEKFMSSLKKIATAAFIEKKDWKRETYKFLFSYRNSPHSTTKVPPAEMMFQRKLRHLIPTISPDIDLNLHKEVDNNDQYAKEKAKAYTDNRFKSEWKDLKTDDLVLVKQRKMNKLTPIFEPHPYRVTEKKGTMVTAQSDINGKSITRNVSHFKRVPEKTEFQMIEEEEDDKEEADENVETNQQHSISTGCSRVPDVVACICNPAKRRLNGRTVRVRIPSGERLLSRWAPIFKRACNPI